MPQRKTEKKIVVVVRQTRLQELRKRFNTTEQARFYVENRGGDFADYLDEDETYKAIVLEAEELVQTWGLVQIIDRSFLPNFIFGREDTVIAIGQDGLVANTLKYLLEDQPLIGVNPDPQRWDGVLTPFGPIDLAGLLPEVLGGRHRQEQVTMALAKLNDGQELLAVNDFFIGRRTHQSSRYVIESAGITERQSSSGIVVSTPLGASGWLKSLLHGAYRIASLTSQANLEVPSHLQSAPWSSRHLHFTVREPFPSISTGADLVFGQVTRDQPLQVHSLMPEDGVLFSDGIEQDFIQFNSGASATISVADVYGNLVA